jgi:NADH dehydrogenase
VGYLWSRWKVSGFLAWLAWLAIHIFFLIGFRNRALVMFHWAYSYVTYRRGARLITAGASAAQEEARPDTASR